MTDSTGYYRNIASEHICTVLHPKCKACSSLLELPLVDSNLYCPQCKKQESWKSGTIFDSAKRMTPAAFGRLITMIKMGMDSNTMLKLAVNTKLISRKTLSKLLVSFDMPSVAYKDTGHSQKKSREVLEKEFRKYALDVLDYEQYKNCYSTMSFRCSRGHVFQNTITRVQQRVREKGIQRACKVCNESTLSAPKVLTCISPTGDIETFTSIGEGCREISKRNGTAYETVKTGVQKAIKRKGRYLGYRWRIDEKTS